MLHSSSPKKDTTSKLTIDLEENAFSIEIGEKAFQATYRCPEDMLRGMRLLIKQTQGLNAENFWKVLEIATAGFKEEKGEAPKQETS